MPRLIRGRSHWQRIKDYIDPADTLLWLSEELETREWETKQFATPVALVLHFVFLVARANSSSGKSNISDDVFSDVNSGPGWLSYIVSAAPFIMGKADQNCRLLWWFTC